VDIHYIDIRDVAYAVIANMKCDTTGMKVFACSGRSKPLPQLANTVKRYADQKQSQVKLSPWTIPHFAVGLLKFISPFDYKEWSFHSKEDGDPLPKELQEEFMPIYETLADTVSHITAHKQLYSVK
jgi:hypothetical protein